MLVPALLYSGQITEFTTTTSVSKLRNGLTATTESAYLEAIGLDRSLLTGHAADVHDDPLGQDPLDDDLQHT